MTANGPPAVSVRGACSCTPRRKFSRLRPTDILPAGRKLCGKPLQFLSQLPGKFDQFGASIAFTLVHRTHARPPT